MNKENWNPGHSPNKGYPYNDIVSRKTFKDRPRVWEREDGKIAIDRDRKAFPEPIETEEDLKDFILHRLIDYQTNLDIAEAQIEDILSEIPFDPEFFGFEVTIESQKPDEPPLRVYHSTLTPGVSLFRKPSSVDAEDWNPSLWTLLRKVDKEGEVIFKEDELLLPCARIAYAALFSLGVKMPEIVPPTPEEHKKEVEEGLAEIKLAEQSYHTTYKDSGYSHMVNFKRDGISQSVPVNAKSDKEALTVAKFLLETDNILPVEDVKFEELSIVKEEVTQ